MKKYFAILLLLTGLRSYAQTGTYTYSIALKGGQLISKTVAEPQFKATNYDCYWFDKPGHDHYFFSNAAGGMGIIILRGKERDTSFEYRDKFQGAQFFINSTYNGKVVIFQGDNDKGMLQVHIATLTQSEIDLTVTGPVYAAYGTNTSDRAKGQLTAHLHLYREARYEQSAKAPNCNCDPTIYPYFYDPEVGRTPSDCENTVLWRIYNTIHPLFYNLNQKLDKSSGSDGGIMYFGSNDNPDYVEEPSSVDACSPDNKSRGVVSLNAAERLLSVDSHSLKYIEQANSILNSTNSASSQANMKNMMTQMAAINQDVLNHKITMDQATKRMNELSAQANAGQPDLKQAEVYHHLDIKAVVNATSYYGVNAGGRAYPASAVVQHNIPGAEFEIYTPSVKDSDGSWSPFKLEVFFGKFNIVRVGNQIKAINPVIPPGVNKLTILNTVISMAGGKDLVDAASHGMDFSSVPAMLANK